MTEQRTDAECTCYLADGEHVVRAEVIAACPMHGRPPLLNRQRAAYDDFERRQQWYKLACEYGQKEDFLALIAAERRDAVEEYKRSAEHKELLASIRRTAINDMIEARNPSHPF